VRKLVAKDFVQCLDWMIFLSNERLSSKVKGLKLVR